MYKNGLFRRLKDRALPWCCGLALGAFGGAFGGGGALAQTKPEPQAAQSASQEQAQQQVLLRLRTMAQEAEKLGLHDSREVKEAIHLARDNVLAQALQEKWLAELKITPAMLEQEYKRQITVLGTVRYRLRHVLVAEESKAQQVLAELQKNKSRWNELAQEQSLDVQSRERGGLSDWVPMGELHPVLLNTVRQLKKGQLAAEPVQTPAGWHVIMLDDVGPYEPPSMEKTTAQLQIALARQYIEGRVQNLMSTAGGTTKR